MIILLAFQAEWLRLAMDRWSAPAAGYSTLKDVYDGALDALSLDLSSDSQVDPRMPSKIIFCLSFCCRVGL